MKDMDYYYSQSEHDALRFLPADVLFRLTKDVA